MSNEVKNEVNPPCKAALVNLNKPMILFSEPPSPTATNSTQPLSTMSSLNSSVTVSSISPTKTMVRLAPNQIPLNRKVFPVNLGSNSLLSKKPLLSSKPLSNTTLVSGTSIGTKVFSMTSNGEVLKNVTPMLPTTSQSILAKPGFKLCYPSPAQVSTSTSTHNEPSRNVIQTVSTSESRACFTPISGSRFAIHPNGTTSVIRGNSPNKTIQNSRIVIGKNPNGLSLLGNGGLTRINNSINLTPPAGKSFQKLYINKTKPVSLMPKSSNEFSITKPPSNEMINVKQEPIASEVHQQISPQTGHAKFVPKQFSLVHPNGKTLLQPVSKSFTLLQPNSNEHKNSPKVYVVNSNAATTSSSG